MKMLHDKEKFLEAMKKEFLEKCVPAVEQRVNELDLSDEQKTHAFHLHWYAEFYSRIQFLDGLAEIFAEQILRDKERISTLEKEIAFLRPVVRNMMN